MPRSPHPVQCLQVELIGSLGGDEIYFWSAFIFMRFRLMHSVRVAH